MQEQKSKEIFRARIHVQGVFGMDGNIEEFNEIVKGPDFVFLINRAAEGKMNTLVNITRRALIEFI